MSKFSETFLRKNLSELTSKQQSIQTLSLWIIHHRKHHSTIVKIWYRVIINEPSESQKLTLIWLANDIIQNSKKKGREYTNAFAKVLLKVFEHIGSISMSKKIFYQFTRILNIWEERGIYDPKIIRECRAYLNKNPPDVGGATDGDISQRGERKLRKLSKAEELIKAITAMELSPSSDVAVRQLIASLPPEVSDVKHIDKLKDKDEVQGFAKQVNDAADLVNGYNAKLSAEMNQRTTLETMLHDFESEQKEFLEKAKKQLKEHNAFLTKLKAFREQVKDHRSKLPDLSKLPDVTRGLTPLPSVENLFKSQKKSL